MVTELDGQGMHDLAKRLWPIHRSITGNGTRQTLRILQEYLPDLNIHEVPSGTQVFDWTIPDEWNPRDAKLIGPDGEIVVDYQDSNLHIVGYSEPVDTLLTLDELQPHLHSIPEQPDAIPYVTSYYNRNWGFCLPDSKREQLKAGTYRATIRSRLEPGSMSYGELVVPGKVRDEIFISTYVCHPSMANNELSGPVVATALGRWVTNNLDRHYTYRFVFAPESIGAIAYAQRNLQDLKSRVVAGFQLTCIGDDRHTTYLASRLGNQRIDRIAQRMLSQRPNFVRYSYLARGSDERTYCAPGIDLPLVSIMRTRYGDFDEYHTSDDDLESVVTPEGLAGGLAAVKDCITYLETNPVLEATHLGEPQLGKRGLYHSMLNKGTADVIMLRTNILAYADGQHDVTDLQEMLDVDAQSLSESVEELLAHSLVTLTMQTNSGALTSVVGTER